VYLILGEYSVRVKEDMMRFQSILLTLILVILPWAALADGPVTSIKEGIKEAHEEMKKSVKSIDKDAKRDMKEADESAKKNWKEADETAKKNWKKAGEDIKKAADK
jgi:predicted Holliday junction resolvase-like endonuclease